MENGFVRSQTVDQAKITRTYKGIHHFPDQNDHNLLKRSTFSSKNDLDKFVDVDDDGVAATKVD